jgi:hypothetical protein
MMVGKCNEVHIFCAMAMEKLPHSRLELMRPIDLQFRIG